MQNDNSYKKVENCTKMSSGTRKEKRPKILDTISGTNVYEHKYHLKKIKQQVDKITMRRNIVLRAIVQ